VLQRLSHRLNKWLDPQEPEAIPGEAAPRHTFRWDLDKTYLRTEFDSLLDLARTAFENAADKKAYPGATALLRALRQDDHRICIVSGSPLQMRQVLAAKLALDGVEFDEFVLKNNLGNLLRGRLRSLRSQVPYKLPAMMASRLASPPAPRETLFGDDAEADAIVYSLYADIVADRVTQYDLERVLLAARAYDDELTRTLELALRVPKGAPVKRIFIHLDLRSPPMSFRSFGRRLVPVFNYFQTALVLYHDGVLSARQVFFVAQEMIDSEQYHLSSLANSLQDLMRRGRLDADTARRLVDETREAAASGAMVPDSDGLALPRLADEFARRITELGTAEPPRFVGEDPPLDYVKLVDQEHEHRRGKSRKKPRDGF
jgi:hypothetical protein